MHLDKVLNKTSNIRLAQISTDIRLHLLVVVNAIRGVGDLEPYLISRKTKEGSRYSDVE